MTMRQIKQTSGLRWYDDDEEDFGFSGRAAYALGLDAPNYPLPTTIGYVSLGQDYQGIVYIDHANADDWVWAWDYLHIADLIL